MRLLGERGHNLQRQLAAFDRHFAARRIKNDVFGTCVGCAVYLSLIPSLAALHRPDLVAAAAAAALACLWPLALCWLGLKGFYVRHHDILFLVHFIFHYNVSDQLARFVRLVRAKISSGSAPGFLIGFILSSTVIWQAVDALMYRMRLHHFLPFKPLIILTTMPLERSLCEMTCEAMPAQCQHFTAVADMLRLVLSPFHSVPQPLLAVGGATESPTMSCFKVQAFLLVLLGWLLPAVTLHSMEAQMLSKFIADGQAAELSAAARTGSDESAAASVQEDARKSGFASMIRWPSQLQSRWKLLTLEQALQRDADAEDNASLEARESQSWPSWGVPLMLAALCWHVIDTLVW